MRSGFVILVSIVFFAVTPVFADDLTETEADILRRKADIQRQEQRIKDLSRLLADDKFMPAAQIGAKAAPVKPDNKGQPTRARYQHARPQDDFDLTNLSVVCFSREGRPVCGRTGYQQ